MEFSRQEMRIESENVLWLNLAQSKDLFSDLSHMAAPRGTSFSANSSVRTKLSSILVLVNSSLLNGHSIRFRCGQIRILKSFGFNSQIRLRQ